MNKIFIASVVATMLAAPTFAQNGTNSTVIVRFSDKSAVAASLDGNFYDDKGDKVTIPNVTPGSHALVVYRANTAQSPRGMRPAIIKELTAEVEANSTISYSISPDGQSVFRRKESGNDQAGTWHDSGNNGNNNSNGNGNNGNGGNNGHGNNNGTPNNSNGNSSNYPGGNGGGNNNPGNATNNSGNTGNNNGGNNNTGGDRGNNNNNQGNPNNNGGWNNGNNPGDRGNGNGYNNNQNNGNNNNPNYDNRGNGYNNNNNNQDYNGRPGNYSGGPGRNDRPYHDRNNGYDRGGDNNDNSYGGRHSGYHYHRHEQRYNDDRNNQETSDELVMMETKDIAAIKIKAQKKLKDADKLIVIEDEIGDRGFTTEQTRTMLRWLKGETARLQMAKWAYEFVTDTENYNKLATEFKLAKSKAELKNLAISKDY